MAEIKYLCDGTRISTVMVKWNELSLSASVRLLLRLLWWYYGPSSIYSILSSIYKDKSWQRYMLEISLYNLATDVIRCVGTS
jgi:hypothetical protein